MAHFNPQMCEPSCCVHCAGRIILDEDNCTLCWETSGSVVRAELWRMSSPQRIAAVSPNGCLCDPSAGTYQLKVFCGIADNVTEYVVDTATVPDDWECEVCSCDWIGNKILRVTVDEATGLFSPIAGEIVTSGLFQSQVGMGVVANAYGTKEVSPRPGYFREWIAYGMSYVCNEGNSSISGYISALGNYDLLCTHVIELVIVDNVLMTDLLPIAHKQISGRQILKKSPIGICSEEASGIFRWSLVDI